MASYLLRLWRWAFPPKMVCGRCGGDQITFKAWVDPNQRFKITWMADDPDDVWCEDCADWGVGSVPR